MIISSWKSIVQSHSQYQYILLSFLDSTDNLWINASFARNFARDSHFASSTNIT